MKYLQPLRPYKYKWFKYVVQRLTSMLGQKLTGIPRLIGRFAQLRDMPAPCVFWNRDKDELRASTTGFTRSDMKDSAAAVRKAMMGEIRRCRTWRDDHKEQRTFRTPQVQFNSFSLPNHMTAFEPTLQCPLMG